MRKRQFLGNPFYFYRLLARARDVSTPASLDAMVAIDLRNCFHDSVFYRDDIAKLETVNAAFEESLKSIAKTAKAMCDHGTGAARRSPVTMPYPT